MDPTQTLIELIQSLEELEIEFDEDPKSKATELARTEALGRLDALRNWLGPLNGFPPKISDIDFEAENEDDDED